MGSCMTTVKVLPNENTQRQQIKRSGTETMKRPMLVSQRNNIAQLADSRDKLLAVTATLEGLTAKLESQAKVLIGKHKRGRSLFALKRMRLYSNLVSDVKTQLEKLESAIVGKEQVPSDSSRLISDAQVLMMEIKDIMLLESPLPERETLKQREEKFKPLFNKYHIQTPDVYTLFAKYEAEVNEITLTTSTVYKKSDFDPQLKSDSDGLGKSSSDGLTKSDSDAPTMPNSEKDLDYACQGFEIKV